MFGLRFALIVLAVVSPTADAQVDSWDDSFVSRHAVAICNVNVARLSESYAKSKGLKMIQEFCQKRHKLEIGEVDQLQFVFSNDPGLEPGADSMSNTKLVFKKPQELDSARVGELTGYRLESEKYGNQELFVGKHAGSWGGMSANRRSVVMGVGRMLRSIVDSQKMKLNSAHNLAGLRKSDVDICLTLSGGKPAAEFANQLFGTDRFSKPLELLSSGVMYLDTKSDPAVTVEFKAETVEDAEALKEEISSLVEFGKQQLKSLRKMTEEHLELMKQREASERFLTDLEKQLDQTDYFFNLLESLEWSTDGQKLRITTGASQYFKQLPEVLVGLFLGP